MKTNIDFIKCYKSTFFVCISLFILTSNGCRRYEEGSLFEFNSACKRIIGTWELEYLYVGGIDSTIYAKNINCNPRMRFVGYENVYNAGYIYPVYDVDSCHSYVGSWAFINHKGDLSVRIGYSIGNTYKPIGSYLAEARLAWNIKRLTDDQLWMDITFNGQYCWIHLKKVKP